MLYQGEAPFVSSPEITGDDVFNIRTPRKESPLP